MAADTITAERRLGGHLVVVALVTAGCGEVTGQTPQVQATVETEPVPSSGDAADDAAVWIHPTDPALSLILGTDKDAGLAAYDLAGVQVQFSPDGELNNVDVRYDFPLGGALVERLVDVALE